MMKEATVGDIQKNFSRVLRSIRSGEQVLVTRRGKPVARIMPLDPVKEIAWPDFFAETVRLKGRPASDEVLQGREERL